MSSRDWDSRYAATELLWGSEPNRFVREELEGLIPGRAVDLACGEGRNAIWLAERGWDVEGVDFSPVAIERAQRLAERRGLRVRFRVGDVLTFEPVDVADLALIAYLQLPPTERAAALRVARAALAPGGTLLLVGHDHRNHAHGVGGPRDATLLWTTDEIVAELDGLEVERAEVVQRPVAGEPRPALDTIVRAKRPPR